MTGIKPGDVVEWKVNYLTTVVNHDVVRATQAMGTHQFHVKELSGNNAFYILESTLDWQRWLKSAFVKVQPRHEYKKYEASSKCLFLGLSKRYDYWLEIISNMSETNSFFFLVDAISGDREGSWVERSIIGGNMGTQQQTEYLVALNLAKNAGYVK